MAEKTHEGPGHGVVTLGLSTETGDGGALHQSWAICECSARALRRQLGPPAHETTASAEAYHATAEAVRGIPGAVHTGEGF
jgi:hypothetical protein